MRFIAALAAALFVSLTLVGSSSAKATWRPVNCSKQQPHQMLACAKRQLHRDRQALRTGTVHHSPGYWHWRVKVAKRWIRVANYRIAHPPIAHYNLWLCIHGPLNPYGHWEGAWNDPNSGNNGHYGGLQMTSPWGQGVYYVYRADWLSPYEQMRKAELGYAASGYSLTWLRGQWNHPECFGYA